MKTLARLLPLHAACLAAALLPAAAGAAVPPSAERESLALYLADDQLVESASRAPKPLSQVAENVTVVTAREIEAMNAHTLADVLNRVTGVFVQFQGHHFGSPMIPHIQGSGETDIFRLSSSDTHVAVLLDGMRWNALSGGAFLEGLPVGIVDRVEIIKGPASSAWGSALAGVINVITKRPGTTAAPQGAMQGTYGERDTYDLRTEAAGAAGPVGYYLQGQRQRAGWDDAGGSFESWSLFGKAEVPLGSWGSLTLSAGHSRPERDNGVLESFTVLAQEAFRNRFARASLDVQAGRTLSFHAAAYRYDQRIDQEAQWDGTLFPRGELVQNLSFWEEHTGVQGRLVWTLGGHTMVLGADYLDGSQEQTIDSGPLFQAAFGLPARFEASPDLERWGVYLNDTFSLGPVTLTPGIRYDEASHGGSFTSPSLGAVWRLGRETLVRLSVARGFTLPSINDLSGGGLGFDPNPDLDPEQVWAYQAGVETGAVPFVSLKLTAFRHEVTDSHQTAASTGTNGVTTVNKGSVHRTGFEADTQTDSFWGLSARLGIAYVNVDKSGSDREQDIYQAKVGLSYRRGPWSADAFGHYVWWDLGPGGHERRHDDFLWDVTAARAFTLTRSLEAEVFAAVHNVFDGNQDFDTDRGTETRWVEGGVRLRF